MAPYAALHTDAEPLTNPTLADLQRRASGQPPRGLAIFDCPWDSLRPLALFPSLEVLKIQSPGLLESLSGLEALPELRVLVITPPPSWDRSLRCIEVASYRPIASLAHLERLTLLNVRPHDLDLAPIASMTHLQDLHLAGVPEFTLELHAALAAALPTTSGRCLQPYYQLEGIGFCKRCGGRSVMLTAPAPRGRKWLCPACQAGQLAAHVERWENLKAAARSARGQR